MHYKAGAKASEGRRKAQATRVEFAWSIGKVPANPAEARSYREWPLAMSCGLRNVRRTITARDLNGCD